MLTITEEQARTRFVALPPSLQDAMFSVQTTEIISGVANDNHLDDTRANKLAQIAGWTLLGFIHPEDVSKELQELAAMPPQVASVVSTSLSAKLFNTLRGDIDKAYAPLPAEKTAAPTDSSGPVILAQSFEAKINTPTGAQKPPMMTPSVPTPQPIPANLQPVTSRSAKDMSVSAIPFSSKKTMPAPAPQPTPAVKSLQDKGWSRQAPQDPVIKLGVITPSIPKPSTPAAPPVAIPSKNITPSAGGRTISEFERLDYQKTGAGKPASPTPSAASPTPSSVPPPAPAPKPPMTPPPTPGPVMLHQVGTTIGESASKFQVNPTMQNEIRSTPPTSSSQAKPIVLEFGGVPVPKPATPPRPPMAGQEKQKVIVKDFLGPQNPPTPSNPPTAPTK
jgi:hypothetical protein